MQSLQASYHLIKDVNNNYYHIVISTGYFDIENDDYFNVQYLCNLEYKSTKDDLNKNNIKEGTYSTFNECTYSTESIIYEITIKGTSSIEQYRITNYVVYIKQIDNYHYEIDAYIEIEEKAYRHIYFNGYVLYEID